MKYIPDYISLKEKINQDVKNKEFNPSSILYIHRSKTLAYENYRPITLYKTTPEELCIECEEMTVEAVIKELDFHINYYK